MPSPKPPLLSEYVVDQLTIDDEPAFRPVGLYGDLKEVLRRSGYRFRVLPRSLAGRWDRALLLNLTFWGASEGGDVLVDRSLPADVVAHAAWHHLASRALAAAPGAAQSPEALFLGEAIASAFDLYLVGRLLGRAPDSAFLETQVPAMAEVTQAAGLAAADFAALLHDIAAAPERAFADLRELLWDVTQALLACENAGSALCALARFDRHRFAPLLHRYELSNWVLYARAYGRKRLATAAGAAASRDPSARRARAVDRALREAADPLDWLTTRWVLPALRPPRRARAHGAALPRANQL